MQTLKIDSDKAKQLYPTATPEFKEMLNDTFGKAFFSQKITDRVKTFEDACKVLGINSPHGIGIISFDGAFSRKDMDSIEAYGTLIIVARALNGGWKPNWNDKSEGKYHPYFNMSSDGFSGVGCDGWITRTFVGSRLCFKSRELAEYAGKQFASIYKDFLSL